MSRSTTEVAMKRLILSIAILLTMVVTDISLCQQASAQNLNIICVEGGSSTSARRRATRTDCSFSAAQSNAIRAARVNASAALSATCIRDIHFEAQRASICEEQGLFRYVGPSRTIDDVRARDGGSPVDGAIPINSALCTVLRDLPNESTFTTTPDNLCFPFFGGQHTTYVARSRAHCGVICAEQF
ncbi:hypothetical protein ABIB00_005038 [Bradyrhizobium sp. LB14.3]